MDMIQETNSQRAQIIITITIISIGCQTSLAIYPISSVAPIQAHTHHPRGPLDHFVLLLLHHHHLLLLLLLLLLLQ
jgi:sorbitol-specific phosphotransferase system component IIBC